MARTKKQVKKWMADCHAEIVDAQELARSHLEVFETQITGNSDLDGAEYTAGELKEIAEGLLANLRYLDDLKTELAHWDDPFVEIHRRRASQKK